MKDRGWRTAMAIAIGALVWCVSATCAVAAETVPANGKGCGALDIWRISTRHLREKSLCQVQPPDLRVQHMLGCNWQPASTAELVAAATPDMPICFLIHGNNTELDEADAFALQSVAAMRTYSRGRSLRVVIWSWPSDWIGGLGVRDDFLLKAARSDVQGYYLAWLVKQLPAETAVSYLGYSYGARMTCAALQLLGGGTLGGVSLYAEGEAIVQRRTHCVFWAAAMPTDWMHPRGRFGLAIPSSEKMLITVNHLDPVLKRFRLLYHDRDMKAVGYFGLFDLERYASIRGRLENLRVGFSIGIRHSSRKFIDARDVMAATADVLYMQ